MATSSNTTLIPSPTVANATLLYTNPNTTGMLVFTPATNLSSPTPVTITVVESYNGGTRAGVTTTMQTFMVMVNPVNQAPTLAAITSPQPIFESATPAQQSINLSGITSGPNDGQQILNVTATSSNTALIPSVAATYTSPNNTGSLTYTPNANASGTATITVTVMDNGGTQNGGINTFSQTFTVTVTPVNQAPSVDPITVSPVILENSSPAAVNLTNIKDGDGGTQVVSVFATSSNTALILPSVTYTNPNQTGTVNITPLPNASGTAVITVTVMDNGGTANNGVNSVSESFTVTVTPVNQAPTLAAIADPAPIPENTTALQTIPLTGISAGPGDTGQSLMISAVSSNPALILNPGTGTGALQISYSSPNSTGSLTYTPAPNAFGSATITVTVMDSGGVLNNGVNTFTQTFNVVVNPVNQAPTIATISNLTIPENTGPATAVATLNGGTVCALNVTYRGASYSSANPPVVTITSPGGTGVTATATALINSSGAVTGFTITSAGSGYSSVPLVTIAASSDQQTVPLSGITAGIGQNETLSVTAASNNTGLIPNPTVLYTSPNTVGSVVFTPVPYATGTATITVTVTNAGIGNGNGASIAATFMVTVTPVNQPPTLAFIPNPGNIPVSTTNAQSVPLTGISSGVGDSGQGIASITATSSNTALILDPGTGTGGAAVSYINPGTTGTLTYTPVLGQSGTAVITVTVTDSGSPAATFSRSFTVTVGAANQAPVVKTSSGSAAFFEGRTAVAVDPGVTVSDSNPKLAGAMVQITGNFVPGEDVLGFIVNGASPPATTRKESPPASTTRPMAS